MSDVTSYPLCWPAGWKRTPAGQRTRATFKSQGQQLSIADAVRRVLREIGLLIGQGNQDRIIISTNIEPRLDGLPRSGRENLDPGVAVYWSTSRQPRQKCMAIDRYDRTADNLAAVAATIEAMRAIERHGGAEILERAFLGFQALPEPAGRPWWEVFGYQNHAFAVSVGRDRIEQKYRELVKQHHPDAGGDTAEFAELSSAVEQARNELPGV